MIDLTYADVIARLRNGLIYDTEADHLKSRILQAYEDMLMLTAREKPKAPGTRFCLSLDEGQRWNNVTGEYERDAGRDVYFIDGFITESKILAIKQVRTLDGSGLKEAKDLVDALQANPRKPSKSTF